MNFLISSLFFINIAYAGTNLGIISGVKQGLASLHECNSSLEVSCVSESLLNQFAQILDQTTTNKCIVSTGYLKASGVTVPKCPTTLNQLSGLDNSYPSGAIFVNYAGDNGMFLIQFIQTHLKNDPHAKINVVVFEKDIKRMLENSNLKKVINQKNINIIPVAFTSRVERWMQDSMQFVTIKGKPALYQLEHANESKQSYSNRLACEIAKQCNLPYFIPEKMVDESAANFSTLNSGGNLEVLPGGTFYRGIVKTNGYNRHIKDSDTATFETTYQKEQKEILVKNGNSVIDIDTSFLEVGHVDEIINTVKTSSPPPCNFAILLASPKKALDLIMKMRFKGAPDCKKYELLTLNNLAEKKGIDPLTDNEFENMYRENCLTKFNTHEFLMNPEYHLIKKENMGKPKPKGSCDSDNGICPEKNIMTIMEDNKKIILDNVKEKTKCDNPKIIEIPVLFKDGGAYLPDQVNGVVQTNSVGASKFITPRSYFKPFDDYVEAELKKVGVDVTLIHDLEYHLLQGEVHCGTNSVPICDP